MDEQFRSKIESTLQSVVVGWEANTDLLHECRQSIFQSNFYKEYIHNYYYNNNNNSTSTIRKRLSSKHFMKEFVKYFQHNIMIWCNEPPCQHCNKETTSSNDTTTTKTMKYIGNRGPITPNEIEGHASRVELYQCSICSKETPFPRYNNVHTLYSISKLNIIRTNSSTSSKEQQQQHTEYRTTRTPGRCGEYANLFGFYCRAFGLETRYVLDFTDHVWVEVLLYNDDDDDFDTEYDNNINSCNIHQQHQQEQSQPQWCMIDSCEGVMNEYSMYEYGWGKQLNYIIAISIYTIIDITCKYTRQFYNIQFQQRRRSITSSEYNSQRIIQLMNDSHHTIVQHISKLSKKEQSIIQQRYKNEILYLQYLSSLTSWTSTNTSASNLHHHKNEYGLYKFGRISGSTMWKALRNENGTANNNNNISTNMGNPINDSISTSVNENNIPSQETDKEQQNIDNEIVSYWSFLGNANTAYDTSYIHNKHSKNNSFEIYIHPPATVGDIDTTLVTETNNNNNNNHHTNYNIGTIRINHVLCATIGPKNKNKLSIVVLDENFILHSKNIDTEKHDSSNNSSINNNMNGGCILQSYTCTSIIDLYYFISTIPSQRIILMMGMLQTQNDSESNNTRNTNDNNTLQPNLNIQQQNELKRILGTHFNSNYIDSNTGIIYFGQALVRQQPDWSYCGTYQMTPLGLKLILKNQSMLYKPGNEVNESITGTTKNSTSINATETKQVTQKSDLTFPQEQYIGRRLKTFRNTRPNRIVGRLSDTYMSLSQQLIVGYDLKRKAFLSFIDQQYTEPNNNNDNSNNNEGDCKQHDCYGYTTKPGAPIYLLGTISYPLKQCSNHCYYNNTNENISNNNINNNNNWNTFLLLPSQLVSDDDNGILDNLNGLDQNSSTTAATVNILQPPLLYDVPIDQYFFENDIGSQLLLLANKKGNTISGGDDVLLPTIDALHNSRLVAYYFSAHWCGPCRSFTPLLAELYDVIKQRYPSHGLEIIFISSDRDEDSFNRYCNTMPWLAVPFHKLSTYKPQLSNKYNVRGIPSLVIIDSISGQIVVDNTEARSLVMQTCQAGNDDAICSMFNSHWLNRIPLESQQILDLLSMSYINTNNTTIVGSKTDNNQHNADELCSYLINKEYMDKHNRIKMFIEQLVEDESMDVKEAYEAALQVEELSIQEEDQTLPASGLDDLFERFIITNVTTEGYHIPLHSELAQCILQDMSGERLLSILTTIWKYFHNCYKQPWNPKFRQFQLSFKVADKITKINGGVELLLSLGFEIYCADDDYVATIPIPTDLDEMKMLITSICLRFDVPMV